MRNLHRAAVPIATLLTRSRSRGTLPGVTPKLPPGPSTPQPLQTLEYVRRPLEVLEESRDRYGTPFTLRLARGAPFVVYDDPEVAKQVFTGDPELLRSGEANRVLRAGLGPKSLIVLDGDEHMRDRKLVLPPFHGERMRRYEEIMTRAAEYELAGWPEGKPFPVAKGMRRIALEVICRAVFGVDEEARVERGSKLLGSWLDTATPPHRVFALLMVNPDGRVIPFFNRMAPALRRVDAFVYEEIERRRADPALTEREDILALLLQARDEDGRPMTDEHLRDELVTLLVAGHETTAASAAWALTELARLPGSLERVAEDEDYADAVVKETLRLRTIAPFVLRMTAAPMQVGGWELPAGVRVAPSSHLIHRRPDIYPEPEAYRPERFLEQPAGTYTWFPFGGGTRRCIGAAFASFEMKTVLRAVARAGAVEPAPGRPEPVGRRGLTLAPAKDARVVWRPRARTERPVAA
jgi:cytochrome P450